MAGTKRHVLRENALPVRRGQILLRVLASCVRRVRARLQALFSAACVTSVDSLVQRALDAVPRATRLKNANMPIREAQCSVKCVSLESIAMVVTAKRQLI